MLYCLSLQGDSPSCKDEELFVGFFRHPIPPPPSQPRQGQPYLIFRPLSLVCSGVIIWCRSASAKKPPLEKGMKTSVWGGTLFYFLLFFHAFLGNEKRVGIERERTAESSHSQWEEAGDREEEE
eukprot:Hpha_TRINITY_DN13987_c0_g4::TRINITY_DN13987_c0_g4_i1::g.35971::m.35971